MSEEKEGIDLIRTTVVIAASIIVAGLAIKTMKFFGFFPDFSKGRITGQSELTPQLYLDNKADKTIDGRKAIRLATQVKDAKGVFNDDEDSLYTVLQEAESKVNLSYISYLFGREYNKSMSEYINGFTNQEERQKIIKLVNQLPKK